MSIPQKRDAIPATTIEDVLVKGNLADLTPTQRTEYYGRMCTSLGLNPLTQPFSYITLNNKLVLYANRACTDQLRKINGISIQIVSQDMQSDLLSVHVKATDKTGRTDEDLGVVSIFKLSGEVRANAILKCVTKAKRRVTLSISGLGYLDETEIEDIPASAKAPPETAVIQHGLGNQEVVDLNEPHDADTGELTKGETPHKIPLHYGVDGRVKWRDWGKELVTAVRAAITASEIEEWMELNDEGLTKCKDEAGRGMWKDSKDIWTHLQAALHASGVILPSDEPE